MTVGNVTKILEQLAPKSNAESFDNVGLIVGSYEQKITKILITLDCLESVVEEAKIKNCNLIITFHPIIFSGLKNITGSSYIEKTVIKAIKNNISIYAIHTNLDAAKEGVNFEICNRLGIKNIRPLIPKNKCIKKLQFYIPEDYSEKVKNSLFEAGAGSIGNYSDCSFSFQGKGTFRPDEYANPFIGETEKLEIVPEKAISVIFEDFRESEVLKALKNNHPYEEIAYEIYTLDNQNQELGMGRIGELDEEIDCKQFLTLVKKSLPTDCVRHSNIIDKKIKKVAVLGGSGSFAIKNAIQQQADAFITADLKYHDFFQANGQILLADPGHYESEQFTKNLLFNYLTKKITNFAVLISEINTNPVKYLK